MFLQVIDEADRVIVEEKQDWYNVFERAVYGGSNLPASKVRLKRSFPLPTIESQCSDTPFTLQKVGSIVVCPSAILLVALRQPRILDYRPMLYAYLITSAIHSIPLSWLILKTATQAG